MSVLIDTSYVSRGRSGTAVYVARLLDALGREGEVEVVEARQRRLVARRQYRRAGRRSDAVVSVSEATARDVVDLLAADPELRERLSAAGRERAALFSWEESARRHRAAYTLAFETRARAGGPG
jgi:hypothetical protein